MNAPLKPAVLLKTYYVQGWIALPDVEPRYPAVYKFPRDEELPLKVIAAVPERGPLSAKPVRISARTPEDAIAHYLRSFEFRERDYDVRLDPQANPMHEMPPVRVIVRCGQSLERAR